MAASDRNNQLTKPPGALGRLENIALWLAEWQGVERPHIDSPQIAIFAANHGIASLGVSAFPTEVTAQMVANFRTGGAAINQLANCFGAKLDVYEIDIDKPTQDFTQKPAMSEEELQNALLIGWHAVDPQADIFIAGEMGIGNTTSASAITYALLGKTAEDWVGRGTGVDDAGLKRKIDVIRKGVALHGAQSPIEVLRCLGGREIAAIVGAIARARVEKIPVILDGFICCSAALVLEKMASGALDHCIAAHQGAEAAHTKLLDALQKDPLLSLELRLGEGSGAALCLGIIKGAAACHSHMATFAEASVSQG